MDTIYGLFDNLDEILKKREIILFEGCKSVLLADTWGIKNAGAILTSHLNPHQMKILARLGCRVVFALDKEIRIREDHNIQKLKNYVEVEYLWDREDLLDDKDAPVDKGAEVFLKLYDGRLMFR
jgi:DNA primase